MNDQRVIERGGGLDKKINGTNECRFQIRHSFYRRVGSNGDGFLRK